MKIYCGFYKYTTSRGDIRLDFLFWHRNRDIVKEALKIRRIKNPVIKKINFNKKDLLRIADKELTTVDATDDLITDEEFHCVLERDLFAHLEDIRNELRSGLNIISYIRESDRKNSIYQLMAFFISISTLTVYDEGFDDDEMEYSSVYDDDIIREIKNYRKLLGHEHGRFDTTLSSIRYLTLVKEL